MRGARRLQKGDEYTRKLILFTPEICAFIQEKADTAHVSFNAALDAYLRASIAPDTLRRLERKTRKRQPRTADPHAFDLLKVDAALAQR